MILFFLVARKRHTQKPDSEMQQTTCSRCSGHGFCRPFPPKKKSLFFLLAYFSMCIYIYTHTNNRNEVFPKTEVVPTVVTEFEFLPHRYCYIGDTTLLATTARILLLLLGIMTTGQNRNDDDDEVVVPKV